MYQLIYQRLAQARWGANPVAMRKEVEIPAASDGEARKAADKEWKKLVEDNKENDQLLEPHLIEKPRALDWKPSEKK